MLDCPVHNQTWPKRMSFTVTPGWLFVDTVKLAGSKDALGVLSRTFHRVEKSLLVIAFSPQEVSTVTGVLGSHQPQIVTISSA